MATTTAYIPFLSSWAQLFCQWMTVLLLLSMPLTSERTGSAPLWGLASCRTLDVDIVGAVGPFTQATRPLWARTPHCLPSHSLLSPLLFPLTVGLEEGLRDSMLFSAHCLVVLLVASFLWCTKAPIHCLSLSFADLLQGMNPCLITLGGQQERSVALFNILTSF